MSLTITKKAYRAVRNVIMERSGLQPKGTHYFSINGNRFRNDSKLKIPLPNLSGELRPIIRQYIEFYGLGSNCLLVSENSAVKNTLSMYYPKVDFSVSDYYTDLMHGVDSGLVDHVWDVCCDPPSTLSTKTFNSIISQSLLEHLIAPTTAIVNFMKLLKKGGFLYMSTHTPSFHYHAYPRDYVRFHHDYFYDLPTYLEKAYGIQMELIELFSRQGVVCVCYKKE